MSNSMRILIVDDQYINRYLLEKLLSGSGYTVISAEDGLQALDIVNHEQVDLIISDILLPRMDGFQFCKEIKSNPDLKHIPFVFYTAAYTEKKDQDLALSLGANRFILKPAEPAEFITIIRDLITEYPHLVHDNQDMPLPDEQEYLTEHNQRLLRQLEKKLKELEDANRALALSEKRYRNLFENANDAIILHEITSAGLPGPILEVNSVACTQLGYSRDELVQKRIVDIESPESLQRQATIMADLGLFGHLTYEGEYLTRDGRRIPVEINAHLYYEHGKRFCLSVCRDITTRKKAMGELSQAVMQINKNIHQMATIGDNIRNPLAIILSTCEDCGGQQNLLVKESVDHIDAFIKKLDEGWVESEKVRQFLQKQYGIGTVVENK